MGNKYCKEVVSYVVCFSAGLTTCRKSLPVSQQDRLGAQPTAASPSAHGGYRVLNMENVDTKKVAMQKPSQKNCHK